MPALLITLASGETHEVAFSPASTLTVISPTRVETAIVDKHHAFTDVVELLLVDEDPAGERAEVHVGFDVDQQGNDIPHDPVDIDATDAARELADANGIDLNAVNGTGADGRITVDDVRDHLDTRAA